MAMSLKRPFGLTLALLICLEQKGIKDTYNRAKESWQDNIEYMTEFAMVLNHKSWQHENNLFLCSLYSDLWCSVEDFIYEHFKDNEEAISYYQRVTDQKEITKFREWVSTLLTSLLEKKGKHHE